MLEEYTNPTPKPKKRRTLGSKFAQPYIPPKPRKVKVPEGQPKKKKRRTTILMPEVFIRNKKAKLRVRYGTLNEGKENFRRRRGMKRG